MPVKITASDSATPAVLKGRQSTVKTGAGTLSNDEVLDGMVKVEAAVQITLPAASQDNEGAGLYVSTSADGATLVCSAGFHGGGTGYTTLALGKGQGCHVYSDGQCWYVLNSSPGTTLS